MGGGAMPKPDLGAAAKKLGITEGALMAALGKSMPPDTAAAAKDQDLLAESITETYATLS
jgi:hypothetical protein